MSVALMVSPRADSSPQATHYVPIATQDVFRRFWIPACEALQLRWVPMFETGIPLDPADVADVLAELEAIKTWIAQQPATQDAIGVRLDTFISEMRALQGASDELKIFIG